MPNLIFCVLEVPSICPAPYPTPCPCSLESADLFAVFGLISGMSSSSFIWFLVSGLLDPATDLLSDFVYKAACAVTPNAFMFCKSLVSSSSCPPIFWLCAMSGSFEFVVSFLSIAISSLYC